MSNSSQNNSLDLLALSQSLPRDPLMAARNIILAYYSIREDDRDIDELLPKLIEVRALLVLVLKQHNIHNLDDIHFTSDQSQLTNRIHQDFATANDIVQSRIHHRTHQQATAKFAAFVSDEFCYEFTQDDIDKVQHLAAC